MTIRERSTAVHEAGHAVIGRILKQVCGSVTIVPDHDSLGHSIAADPFVTMSAWEEQGRYRDEASVFRGRMLAMMAGAEAEVAILGRCAGGDGDDRREIEWMAISGLGLDDEAARAAYLARLRSRATWLCRRHRELIETVADALMQAGTLQADEVTAFVEARS